MFQFFDPDPLTVDLALILRSAEQETPIPTGQDAPDVAGESRGCRERSIYHQTAPQTKILRFDQQFFFQFHIAEA